jgi:Cft2 family RNA processing exonuclease
MNIQLDTEFNYVLSTVQMADIRFALRTLLLNLRETDCKLVFRPSSNNGTRESEIEVLEQLLNDIQYDKVRLSNFIDKK